ncbi:MAG: shikimate kinase [gamma proteobacterium symbiont of Bathyaustriella thionipta]|nr:shikimate kinase [gamma proteobacterium symbiont of Bathyaustriella thionipta]MCU7955158.1 shikimate kinase [gamma proteobacterium symbiont of Bathyaustriella thionipta]MCU7968807.1 shikimate kinase [gamma proteobacterium symbiont of Bathyaustriella thionipta]
MGAGKTTVGRQIARNLGFDFFDSDKEIEERTGVSIPLIFELEGESGFRKREQDVIFELSQKKHIVLATGGGAVLNSENQKTLKRSGTVVYLCASIDDLLERTSKDKNRPLLQTDNPRATLQSILTEREPIYRELADIILETNTMSVHAAVKELEKLIS